MNLLVIDIGTSSMRGILYREDGRKTLIGQIKYKPDYGENHAVEQKPGDFEDACVSILRKFTAGWEFSMGGIEAIVLTAQRSSVIPVDQDGKPLFPAIMWQDTRNREICRNLEEYNGEIRTRSGSNVNCVFSGGKMSWFKEEYPDLYKKTCKFVNIPEYLMHLMTGRYVTDYTYGSRSNLMNLHTCTWDQKLLALFGIEEGQLCELHAPGEILGRVTGEFSNRTGIPEGTAVISAGGDQQCAALGHGVYEAGRCSVTTGTGGYLIALSDVLPEQLSEDVIWNYSAVPGRYILEGSILTCCSAFDWFLRSFYDWEKPDYEKISRMLEKKYDKKSSCIVLPYFQGRSTPIWNAKAHATFHGIDLGQDREDLLKALLEGIFIEIDNNMDHFRRYVELTQVSISGGLTGSAVLNQMQADVYGIPLSRLLDAEATANGAFMSAAVRTGLCASLQEAFHLVTRHTRSDHYVPNADNHKTYIKLKQEMNRLYQQIYREEDEKHEQD